MLRNLLILIIFLTLTLPALSKKYDYLFCVNNQNVYLEEAKTIYDKRTGLMYRSYLHRNTGMLFRYSPPSEQSFWMKNVNFPLDIVFMFKGKIVKIYENVQPCKCNPCKIYRSEHKVDKVIELNSGFCKKNGLKEGSQIKLKELK